MVKILEKVRAELIQNVDQKVLESGQRFFKEKISLYGVKSALVEKIAKENFGLIKYKSKAKIFDLCEELWKSAYLEESFVACNWAYHLRKEFKREDFQIFEKWIDNYVDNWASCDTFCNHTVGTLVEMYPEFVQNLKEWATSGNRWVRRASAVSLIIPAKQGKFLPDIFEIADILLLDSDDLVQKGYGWMLKAASQSHQKEVFDFVYKNKKTMPRTALRYAIEKMPKELREKAMR